MCAIMYLSLSSRSPGSSSGDRTRHQVYQLLIIHHVEYVIFVNLAVLGKFAVGNFCTLIKESTYRS